MSRASVRALARLRAKAAPILEERKREREREREQAEREAHKTIARDHAIRVISVFMKGEPKIDEPLHLAWRRVHEYFDILHSIDEPVPTEFFYERIIKDLPGSTPDEKLEGAIEQAPDWLRYFCFTRKTMFRLSLGSPSDSEAEQKWKVPIDDRHVWPFLPKGILEPAAPFEISTDERFFLIKMSLRPKQDRTPDEARRVEELLMRTDERGLARLVDVRIESDLT